MPGRLRLSEALLIMTTLPFILTGCVWLHYWLSFSLSVDIGAALLRGLECRRSSGVMLIYLQNAWHSRVDVGREAVAVIIAVLLPILRGDGAGSELMKHIAAPMVGGIDHHHCCRCWCCRLPTG